MSNKILSTLAALAFVGACGTNQIEQQLFTSVVQGVNGKSGTSQPSLTIAQIRQQLTPEVRAQHGNLPFMIAYLEVRNRASVLIPAGDNRDVTTYMTPDGISIFLKQGMLVGTRGFGFDLMTADVSDVLSNLHDGGRAVRVHRYLDGEDQLVIKSFVCDYTGKVPIVESCYGKSENFENSYTIQAGRVLASRQWIGPEFGYIVLEPS